MTAVPIARMSVQHLIPVLGQQIRVNVRDGSGVPLVVCNGIGASLEVLDPLVDHLDPGTTVVRFDVPVIHFHLGEPQAKDVERYRDLGVEHVLLDLPTEPRDQTLRRLDELKAEFAQLA